MARFAVKHAPGEGHVLTQTGFAVIPGFLGSRELPAIRSLVSASLLQPQDAVCRRPHNDLFPLRWSSPLVQKLLGFSSSLEKLWAVINADDPRWISGYISSKAPYTPPLWWHQDWWCWDHPVSYQAAASQLAILCYLSETSEQNGALRVLPGTHRKSVPVHSVLPEAHNHALQFLEPDHAAFSDQPDQITICAEAGDAVVIDYRLLHGTHANKTSGRRDCVILNFAPSWRMLPDDIKGHLICHTALPAIGENGHMHPVLSRWLPNFDGKRLSLPINRHAPPEFEIATDTVDPGSLSDHG